MSKATRTRKGQSSKARENGLKYGKFMRRNDNRTARHSISNELREYRHKDAA